MISRIERTRRSNHSIFLPQNYGSPFNDTAEHISGLGLARIDFEGRQVAGDVIYSVEADSTPTSQQDEEARIATLAHALKKLGNPEDAAEFMRCLNAICEGGDARYRQVAASYYYGEIAERGAGPVLKEMALIAMHLASLNPVMEEVESDSEIVYALRGESKPQSPRFFSRANLEFQRLTRDALEGILEACFGDYHSTAMRNNNSYRRFYARIRRATDAKAIGELMKQAYEARQDGNLSVKHFIALNTATDNQRERCCRRRSRRVLTNSLTRSSRHRRRSWGIWAGRCMATTIPRIQFTSLTRVNKRASGKSGMDAKSCFHSHNSTIYSSAQSCARLGGGRCQSPVLSSRLWPKIASNCHACAKQ
jgi:hypothetical protein